LLLCQTGLGPGPLHSWIPLQLLVSFDSHFDRSANSLQSRLPITRHQYPEAASLP
jgi:hypothetical protein